MQRYWRRGGTAYRSIGRGSLWLGSRGMGASRGPSRVGRRPTVQQAIGDLPVVQADVRDEVQVYQGRPTTVLARLLRKGLRGSEALLIRDHVTRSVRPGRCGNLQITGSLVIPIWTCQSTCEGTGLTSSVTNT